MPLITPAQINIDAPNADNSMSYLLTQARTSWLRFIEKIGLVAVPTRLNARREEQKASSRHATKILCRTTKRVQHARRRDVSGLGTVVYPLYIALLFTCLLEHQLVLLFVKLWSTRVRYIEMRNFGTCKHGNASVDTCTMCNWQQNKTHCTKITILAEILDILMSLL